MRWGIEGDREREMGRKEERTKRGMIGEREIAGVIWSGRSGEREERRNAQRWKEQTVCERPRELGYGQEKGWDREGRRRR